MVKWQLIIVLLLFFCALKDLYVYNFTCSIPCIHDKVCWNVVVVICVDTAMSSEATNHVL
jgi:hypothetical protein